jgi:hypothetical protein
MGAQAGSLISADTIYTAGQVREQILNYTNWAGLNYKPNSYALFTALGTVAISDNNNIVINDDTGFYTRFNVLSGAGDIIIPALGGVVNLDFDTLVAAGTNVLFREGMCFHIFGWSGATHDDRITAQVVIVAPAATGWTVKTIATQSSAASDGSVTFDNDAREGTVLVLSESSDKKGAAPSSLSLTPTSSENWLQYYRFPYGWSDDMISQDNHFGNVKENTAMEAESLMFKSFNNDMLFSKAPKKHNATLGTIVGTGLDKCFQGGLPYFMGAAALHDSDVKSHYLSLAYAATGVTPTTAAEGWAIINALQEWADKFESGGKTLLCICSTDFRNIIRRAAQLTGTVFYEGEIMIPTMAVDYQEIKLGHIKIRLVVDDEMEGNIAPFISKTVGVTTHYCYKNLYCYAVDPDYIGICYRRRKGDGIMAPNSFAIDQERNRKQEEHEYTMEGCLGLWHKRKHGMFFFEMTDNPN